MANKKISIIVPVYKVEEDLDRCVQSIVDQTYKNLEILLIDDGSPDNCPAMCDEWAKKDKRIKVIHKENGGVSSVRNLGLELATGEYIGFVDSDDYIDATMYEKLYNKIQEDKSDFVACGFIKVFEDGRQQIIQEINWKNVNAINFIEYLTSANATISKNKKTTTNIMGSIWRMLFKKEIISSVKFRKMKIAEDMMFLLDVTKNEKLKISYLDEYLYYYIERSVSAINHISRGSIESRIKMAEVFLGNYSDRLKEPNLTAYKYHLYKNVFIAIAKSDDKTFRELLKNETIINLNSRKNYKMAQKYTQTLKGKVVNFLARHKMFGMYKFFKKFAG